ncbi:class I SAM-dependent methyltransferase [Amnibacterium endophyticum]|uniref:Class I SAM-dependent methyltransferase n=1 Tax=Amnibacterium endophyticum TaxID=2109337 RepID=A0ABW4LFK0_9MICO
MADWSGAEAYACSFAVVCADAVPAALDARGTPRGRLLDVGSGPGTLALAAAARGWSVTAVEPEPAMRRLARAAGLEPVDGALPVLPFEDGAFEAVAANLVVNHLPDPRAGVAGLVRVAAPGGAVAVSIWGTGPASLSALWSEVLARAGVAPLPGSRLPPERDFARTPDGLAALLSDAGLAAVRAEAVPLTTPLPRDDLWSAVEAGIGVIGATWRAEGADGRARLRAAYESVVPGPRIEVRATAVVASGNR